MTRRRFSCPSCEAVVVVDAGVHATILEDGCPLCLAPVSEADFEAVVETEP